MARRRVQRQRWTSLSSSSSSFESSSDSDSDGDAFSFSSTGSSEEVDEADDRDLPQSETKGTSQQHHNHHDVRMAFHHETPFTPLREKQEKARRQRSNMGVATATIVRTMIARLTVTYIQQSY